MSSQIEDFIQQLLAREELEGIVVGYVIVADLLEPSTGDQQLVTLTDTIHPYWHHRGMLDSAELPSLQVDDDDD